MNKNLPHAVKIVRAAIASSGSDPSAAIAHALDGAKLLVDPERSYGVLMRRQPEGEWVRASQTTELEQQAAAWDASCRRAAELAERIRSECGQDSGLQEVRPDGDRLLVSVHVTTPDQWGQWRRYLGITSEESQPLEYAYVGAGHRDGVAVSVVAYDAPEVEARTVAAATMPHRYGGVVYDFAFSYKDSQGDIWDYAGLRGDGTPLLQQRGADIAARCSLPNVVEYVGPLTAVRDEQPIPGVRQTAPAVAELATGGEPA
ncbi:BN159_2729 family protein [Streptomyces chryseus]